MAFDFPATPTVNQVYTPTPGVDYKWDGSAWLRIGTSPAGGFPANIAIWVSGKPAAAETVFAMKSAYAFVIPAALDGTTNQALVAATGACTWTLKKNGASFGTIVFSPAGTVGTYTAASATSFAINDIFSMDAPSTQDATLANFMATIAATRS
jgi:hypothetical protein